MYRSCAHGVPLCPQPQSSTCGLGVVPHVVQGNRHISKMVSLYLLKYTVSVNLDMLGNMKETTLKDLQVARSFICSIWALRIHQRSENCYCDSPTCVCCFSLSVTYRPTLLLGTNL